MAVVSKVHAEFGQWSPQKDQSGKTTGYVGRFDNDVHAFGAARHFSHSSISSGFREPTREGGYYVIRLLADQGDNLKKFEEFAARRELPGLPLLPAEDDKEVVFRKPALAYRPLTPSVAKDMVKKLSWQSVGDGFPLPSCLVTVTEDPILAFQAAYWLKTNGYLGQESFDRLNEEIRYNVQNGVETEYRVATVPDRTDEFNDTVLKDRQTPQAMELGHAQIREIHALSKVPMRNKPR